MLSIVIGLVVILVVLLIVLVVRTLRLKPQQEEFKGGQLLAVEGEEAIGHLAGALRIATMSHLDASRIYYSAFLELHHYLEETYPLVHQMLKREVVNQYSLLYT